MINTTTGTNRWKRRPTGSTWGDWGPDDQLGRLNLLTPEKIKEGVAEVREGLAFCLSLPLDYPGGTELNAKRFPPVLRPLILNDRVCFPYVRSVDNPELTDLINDDAAIIHLQYSSQWDALAHGGQLFDADGDGVPEPLFYNGYRAGVDIVGPTDVKDAGANGTFEARTTSYAHKLGIEKMAEKCVQGRGVMIDLHAHFGREKRYISYDDLMGVIEKDRVTVEPGDMLCLHTGYAQGLLEMKKQPDKKYFEHNFSGLDGRDERLLQWITDSQIAALISDNQGVEMFPARPSSGVRPNGPLHAHCLFKLGLNLGEFWYLTALAEWLREHGRFRFLLTAPPLRLPGAVGSPPSPIATV